jgi:antitoxin component YwqK of YwqJK toxin-antitoxin module
MPKKEPNEQAHIHYHRDGSVWAKGKQLRGKPAGYWEWFRKDGTKLRSGYFEGGKQVGEWTTYDKKGRVYKVTLMKANAAKRKKA